MDGGHPLWSRVWIEEQIHQIYSLFVRSNYKPSQKLLFAHSSQSHVRTTHGPGTGNRNNQLLPGQISLPTTYHSLPADPGNLFITLAKSIMEIIIM